MRGLALLGLATAALAAEIKQKDVVAQHDGHVDGFHLRSIIAGDMTQYNIKPTERAQREAQSLDLPTVDVQTASKARTTVCAKLAMLLSTGYTGELSVPSYLEEITAAGNGAFSATNATRDVEIMLELIASVSEEIGEQVSEFGPGIKAALWVSADNTSILAFFGAAGTNDDLAALYQTVWYNIDKTKEKMKNNWINEAGLAWGEKQEAAEAVDASFYYDSLFDEQVLASAVVSQGLAALGLPVGTVADAFEIATAMLYSAPDVSKFMITGNSLGGSRAGASSIFLKTLGVTVPTITFASTGTACWNYRLFSGDTVAASLYDTTVEQSQITEYVHPLDTYGHAYGLDIGTECYLGIDDSSFPSLETTKSWCGAIYGYEGANLAWIESASALQAFAVYLPSAIVAALPGLMRTVTTEEELLNKYHSQCRYFTHHSIVLYNRVINELNDDGSTLSGCHVNTPVPVNDIRCPMNTADEEDSDDDFFGSSTKAPPFYVFGGLALIAIFFFVGRCIMCPPQPSEHENEPIKEVDVIESDKAVNVGA